MVDADLFVQSLPGELPVEMEPPELPDQFLRRLGRELRAGELEISLGRLAGAEFYRIAPPNAPGEILWVRAELRKSWRKLCK